MAAGLLRFRAENGVAAAHVGQHRMRPAFGVFKIDAVLFTGTAAIAIAGSLRQEAAEDAVLGMKHRQMLIGDGLDSIRTDAQRECRDLRGVQIVGRSQTLQAEIQEQFGADRVGYVETKVADQWRVIAPAKCVQQARRADQDGAVQADQKIENPRLARLEHARTGDSRRNATGLHTFDGGT